MPNISDRLTSRDHNNFNLLRLLAAVGVIVTHSYALLGKPERDYLSVLTHGLLSFSRLGVYVFFVISGFLIAFSLQNSKSIRQFFWKRFLRIFPGLFVVLFLTVFIMGPLVTKRSLGEYFLRPGTYHYLVGGLTLYNTQYQLPGVFSDNPRPNAINGSLWTLPYEWTCYVFLACIIPFVKKRRGLWVAGLCVLFLLIRTFVGRYQVFEIIPIFDLDVRQLMLFGTLFFLGCLAFFIRRQLWFSGWLALVSLFGFLIFRDSKVAFYWMLFTLPYLVLWLATIPLPARIAQWFSRVDFSYGLYIYAFPIGQLLVWKFNNFSVSSLAFATLVGTLPLAILSWYLLEKPALLLKL